MKKAMVVFLGLVAWAAAATQPEREDTLEAKGARSKVGEKLVMREVKLNEIGRVRLTYSGIIVEVVKTKNPLELINPAAPSEYGWAEDNVVRNVIDRKVTGLKFFSIEF